ncbi:MAG: CRTAC1 family protein [Deltaproteobacteria bacterium]|nr:CRTAC1 family protein [Deltaproteobacteria bacterium]
MLAAVAVGCRDDAPVPSVAPPPAEPSLVFNDVTDTAGITFHYTFGDFAYDNILESSGSGVAFLDYNNDGDYDLLFLNGRYLEDISDPKGRVFRDASNALYRNNGDGTFTDVTDDAGLGGGPWWSMAAGCADYDGDGFVDVLVANYGSNRFFHNNGDGTFTDRTDDLGLAGPEKLNGGVKWSVAVAPFDGDGDGDLDILVGNFLAFDPYYLSPGSPHRMPSPVEYPGQPSSYYRRLADGRYEEVAAEVGLHFPQNKVMGLTVFDADEDGGLDIFQANDHHANYLLRNRGDGTFEDVGAKAGVAVNHDGAETGSMHGSLGDVDGDGHIDILVTDLRYGSLYRNLGDGRFTDIILASGAVVGLRGAEAWGAGLHDFDNDGDVDLFSTNGAAETLVEKPPTLMLNDGAGNFVRVGGEAGPYFAEKRSGRGAAFGDYDNDGDIDIAINHVDLKAKATLLRNDTNNGHHWFGVELEPTRGAPEPIGAVVRLTAGGRTQVRVYQPTQSYLSQNDPRLHFGLGRDARVETLEIQWPGRAVQKLTDLPADQYYTVIEP